MENKKALVALFEAKITEMLNVLTQSAKEAHAAATHTESKAEDQYDTRGLEAAYLAGAQSRRAMELEQMLNVYRFIDLKPFGPGVPIAATAIIELRNEDGHSSHYFLMPSGGGMKVDWCGKKIQTITPQSPLGEMVLGKSVGDEISIRLEGKMRDLEIVSVA